MTLDVVSRSPGRAAIVLHGRLVRHTALALHRAVVTTLNTHPRELVLDANDVRGIDACGLDALRTTQRAADQLGCRLAILAAGSVFHLLAECPALRPFLG